MDEPRVLIGIDGPPGPDLADSRASPREVRGQAEVRGPQWIVGHLSAVRGHWLQRVGVTESFLL